MFPIVTANNKNETEPSHDATCVVTHAMKQREDELVNQKETQFKKACTDFFVPDLSALSFPVSAEELGKEQRADSSLDVFFQCAVTPAEMGNLARGYVVSDGMLLRKRIPHKGDFVGDPVFQVVVPVKFRRTMIEIAYDRLLRYYFWPRLNRDISSYIKKCKICQLTSKPNQVLKPYYENETKAVQNKISAHSVLSSVSVGGGKNAAVQDAAGNGLDVVNRTAGWFVSSGKGTALAYSSLLLMALLSIFFGALKSVGCSKSKSASDMPETITSRDAARFSIIVSWTLFGLYRFKIFSQEYIKFHSYQLHYS